MPVPYLEIYRRLARLRFVEEAIAREYDGQQMRCPVHLCLGQEAVSTGAASSVTASDALWGTHRSHGPYVAAGGDLYAFFAELYGKAEGCCGGRGGSMHLLDLDAGFWGAVPIVGSTIPIATGAALAFQMRKTDRVSMIVLGEGATEEGVFHESLQFAALKRLPVVYVCENNGFAVNTPLRERRPDAFLLSELVAGHGIPVARGDGNNVFSVHELCAEAVARARSGSGPTFLEFETSRWVEHCGPHEDRHLPGRSENELAAWKKRCPVRNAEKYLMHRGLIGTEELEALCQAERDNVESALLLAKEAPFPDSSRASLHVYAGA